MNAMNLTPPQRPEDQLFTDIAFSYATREPRAFMQLGIDNSDDLMRSKFQRRSI